MKVIIKSQAQQPLGMDEEALLEALHA